MSEGEKVVARFKDGRLLKGYVRGFRIDSDAVNLREHASGKEHSVQIGELKAIFFVKSFEGYSEYIERKAYGIGKNLGCKVFITFIDKESLLGFVEGDVPWDRGFSLAKLGNNAKGFFLIPVDNNSNNSKVFVVGSAIENITIMAP